MCYERADQLFTRCYGTWNPRWNDVGSVGDPRGNGVGSVGDPRWSRVEFPLYRTASLLLSRGVAQPLLVRRAGRSYTGCMMRSLPDSKQAVRSAARRLGAWTRRPFDTGYRWGLPLALYAGLCLALPAGAGLALFLPPALALAVKAVRVSQRIHRLDFVRLVDENGTAGLPRRPSLTGSPGSTTSSACSDRRRTTSCARTP